MEVAELAVREELVHEQVLQCVQRQGLIVGVGDLGKGNSNSHGARPVHLIITESDQ